MSIAFLCTDHADAPNYQNPASPEVLTATPPWEIPRSDTATPIPAIIVSSYDAHPVIHSTSSMHVRPTADLLASSAEAGVPESQDIIDGEVRSSVSAVSLQANVPGAELSSLTDSAEPTDDMPEDRPGVSGRDR